MTHPIPLLLICPTCRHRWVDTEGVHCPECALYGAFVRGRAFDGRAPAGFGDQQ